MLSLQLRVKLLFLLLLGLAMSGVYMGHPVTAAPCGACASVQEGTVIIGWGCVGSSDSRCTATSTGCTQCASCSCGGELE